MKAISVAYMYIAYFLCLQVKVTGPCLYEEIGQKSELVKYRIKIMQSELNILNYMYMYMYFCCIITGKYCSHNCQG